MTDSRLVFRRLAALAVALGPIAMEGCTPPPPPPVSTARLYAIDQQGAAATCTAAPVKLEDGKTTPGALTVANDGGWCAITVAASGNKPYSAGLLTTPSAHGRVYVHTVGDATRIDYTPDTGFTGADTFTVTLLPGSPVLQVAATVTAGPASVPPPAPPPPAPTPARKRGAGT